MVKFFESTTISPLCLNSVLIIQILNFISEALESEDPQDVELTNAIKEVRFK